MDIDRSRLGQAAKTKPRQRVYSDLVLHQCNEDWHGRDVLNFLHEWAVKFNVQFKLHVPQITLGIEPLRVDVGGHFRYGHNQFGLRGEIIINSLYLHAPTWWVLGVLLHEELHGWQQTYGTVTHTRANYHNKEFRLKALSLGLVVDRFGFQEYWPNSPFVNLLREHGIEVPDFGRTDDDAAPSEKLGTENGPVRGRGNSKLKKWSCGCTNVRVAVADFRAKCLKCHREFVREGEAPNHMGNRRGGPLRFEDEHHN